MLGDQYPTSFKIVTSSNNLQRSFGDGVCQQGHLAQLIHHQADLRQHRLVPGVAAQPPALLHRRRQRLYQILDLGRRCAMLLQHIHRGLDCAAPGVAQNHEQADA